MPKIVDHDQQRRELLQKCFDLFRRRGYEAVTLREIAREIGASTGTLYHYFPNKLSILEQLYELAVQDDLGSLDGASDKGVSQQEKLRRLAAIWIRRRETTHSGLLLLALDLHRNSPEHASRLLSDYAARYKQAISRSLGVGPEASDAVFTYLLGANLHAVLAPRDYSFRARVRGVEQALAAALEPSKAPLAERIGRLGRKGPRRR
jgi:AcrR family transcriptional regulator